MTDASSLLLLDSVYQYLTQPRIRTAVDSVLDYGVKKLPPGLEWEELPQFYRAALAASSVQVEWALTLEDLWRRTWPATVAGWTALSVDVQNTRDLSAQVGVEKCWDEGWFGRCFTRPAIRAAQPRGGRHADDPVVCLGVSLALEGVAIGLSLDLESDVVNLELAGFGYDEEHEGWWIPEQGIAGQTVDLGELQQAALKALQWLAQQPA